jgi:hypothetical protein
LFENFNISTNKLIGASPYALPPCLPCLPAAVPGLLGFCKGFCKLKDPMKVRSFLARVKQDPAGALYRMDDAWMGNTFLIVFLSPC